MKTPVITPLLDSSQMLLNTKCELSSEACAIVNPFNTFKVTLTSIDAMSSMILNEVKVDVCDILSKMKNNTKEINRNTSVHVIKYNFMSWGIPFQCPIKEKFVHCYNKTKVMKLSPSYQKLIPLVAKIQKIFLKMFIEHDTGTSCMETTCSYVKMN